MIMYPLLLGFYAIAVVVAVVFVTYSIIEELGITDTLLLCFSGVVFAFVCWCIGTSILETQVFS